MSYPTARTLQYGVTQAQESTHARPHVPTFMHCNVRFPRHPECYGLPYLALQDSRREIRKKPAPRQGSRIAAVSGPDEYNAFARTSRAKQGDSGVLTRSAARIECLSRAAPK